MKLTENAYEIDIIVSGFPGKSVCHGGLGWSTIALVRGRGRVALIDVGTFGMRKLLREGLAARGLTPADVTDVILTHAHHDHAINWVMFPHARIVIGRAELEWSVGVPWGETMVPELYMERLHGWESVERVEAGDEVLPGMTSFLAPGHTPGHLVYVLKGEGRDVIFCGDSAKNRAEMVGGHADASMDDDASRETIAAIWRAWKDKAGSVLVPGHDLPMVLEDGAPRYLGERKAGIAAFYGDDIETTTEINLVVD